MDGSDTQALDYLLMCVCAAGLLASPLWIRVTPKSMKRRQTL